MTSQKPLIYLIETFHLLSLGGIGPETKRSDPTALENPQHIWNIKESHCDPPQSWKECRTTSQYMWGRTHSQAKTPPEVRDALGEKWSARSCSSCGFSFSRYYQYWGPPEARHRHHQLGPFQLLTTFILHDQIMDWSLCWLSISLRSKCCNCEIKSVLFLLDSRVLDEYLDVRVSENNQPP